MLDKGQGVLTRVKKSLVVALTDDPPVRNGSRLRLLVRIADPDAVVRIPVRRQLEALGVAVDLVHRLARHDPPPALDLQGTPA